jgi:site-specific recombinase
VKPYRLDRLLASVPDAIDAGRRARLLAHVEATEECRIRIDEARQALHSALGGDGASAVDRACDLDRLERVQERLDHMLVALVDDLTRVSVDECYDDGVPAV